MSTALQIDSTCFRTLQNDASHKLTRRSIEALYTILEDNSENRSMLQKIGVPFLNSEETLIIPGENAAQISRFSKVPLYPLFTNGERSGAPSVAFDIDSVCTPQGESRWRILCLYCAG